MIFGFDADHPPCREDEDVCDRDSVCCALRRVYQGLPGSLLWIVTPMSMTWVPCGVAMTLESLHEFAMLISLMSKFQESSVMKVSSQDSIFDTGSHVDESFHEMAMLMSQDLASVAALSKRLLPPLMEEVPAG